MSADPALPAEKKAKMETDPVPQKAGVVPKSNTEVKCDEVR